MTENLDKLIEAVDLLYDEIVIKSPSLNIKIFQKQGSN